MGFDAWFFSRIDHQDREKRNVEKNLEFITRTPYNENIFTHILYYEYFAPKDYNFDYINPDENIDDKNI
jgi:hypothetical protein